MTAPAPRRLFTCAVFVWAGLLLAVQMSAALLLLPWTLLADRDRRVAARLGSWLVRWSLRVPQGWRASVRDLCSEEIPSPCVVVMNHSSIADVALAIALPCAPRLMAKPWVSRIPLMRFVMWSAGHVEIDSADPGSVRDGLDALERLLRRGVSVVVFPEGTRRAASDDAGVGPFGSGAFWLSERTLAPVVPVVVIGSGRLIAKGSGWFTNATVQIRFLPRIAPVGDHDRLRRIVRDAMATRLAESRVGAVDPPRDPAPADA